MRMKMMMMRRRKAKKMMMIVQRRKRKRRRKNVMKMRLKLRTVESKRRQNRMMTMMRTSCETVSWIVTRTRTAPQLVQSSISSDSQ